MNSQTENRCPKILPTQACIYTTQGEVICNKPDQKTKITREIPYYNEILNEQFKYLNTK